MLRSSPFMDSLFVFLFFVFYKALSIKSTMKTYFYESYLMLLN